MRSAPSKSPPKPSAAQMRMNAGYVTFIEFEPQWPDAMSPGGIALTTGYITGANDHSKSMWGKVHACGSAANRATTEPFQPEVQTREGFPLSPGTWIVGRKANHWTLAQDIKAFATHDIVAFFPAAMTWEQICAELKTARQHFQEVA